jgi:hypothetical protein
MKKIAIFCEKVFVWKKPVAMMGIVLMVFNGCRKDSDDAVSPASPTTTQMLTEKPWRLTASTISPAMMGMTDLFSMMPSCELDNTLKFNSDASKSLVQDEGATKCNSMDPQQVSGSWQLNIAETEVVVNLNSQSDTYALQSISTSSLRVAVTTVMSGTTYTITNTYSNQ